MERTSPLNDAPRAEAPDAELDAAFGEAPVLPLAEVEKLYILHVLRRMNGNRTRTARALEIGANTLWRKLKKWGVDN